MWQSNPQRDLELYKKGGHVSAVRFWHILMLCAGAIAIVWLLLMRSHSPVQHDPDQVTFWRAVYVLQHITGNTDEDIEIPRLIRYDDDTESLLHHSDTVFVLRNIAETLASLSTIPEAKLFEGYAWRALGEHTKALASLSSYVAEAPFKSRHYEMLCDSAHAAGDFLSQYLMSREWAGRDPRCSEIRSYHAWSALYNLGRYQDAQNIMKTEGECLGWRANLYSALAMSAQGNMQDAQILMERTVQEYPAQAASIRLQWERMQVQSRF